MEIGVFAPYGALTQETGLVVLLANYLKRMAYQVEAAHCNGMFTFCDRDAEQHWQRSIERCFECQHEQKELSRWAGVDLVPLGSHLSPSEVEATRRWAIGVPTESLLSAEWEGVNLASLSLGTFQNRFGVEVPDLQNKSHEQILRRLILSSLRAWLASRRFLEKAQPKRLLVAGEKDFLSRSMIAAAAERRIPLGRFSWDINQRTVVIRTSESDRPLTCGLVLHDLISMRSDAVTWSPDLIRILDSILEFLHLEPRTLQREGHLGIAQGG